MMTSERRAAIERSLQGSYGWFDSEISEDLHQAFVDLVEDGMIMLVRDADGKDRWMLTAKGRATDKAG